MRERHPELPEAIKSFLEQLEQIGVYPEFKRSLNIKWDPPSGNSVNLGWIMRNGQLWTDATNWSGADLTFSKSYLVDLADQIGGDVRVNDTGYAYVTIEGQAPRIEALMGMLDNWFGAIGRFQTRIRTKVSEVEQ